LIFGLNVAYTGEVKNNIETVSAARDLNRAVGVWLTALFLYLYYHCATVNVWCPFIPAVPDIEILSLGLQNPSKGGISAAFAATPTSIV